ncbi:MAG: vitamin B12 dependent methionine synthase [Candidatus Aminicenantes bacterium]|nr:MAG: vitamin B12 dependent methionine synthase [Candidatus Aminicenantes bacterium]
MQVIENIPIELALDNVVKALRLNKERYSSSGIQEFIAIAESLIQPKACYEVAYINKKEKDKVKIEDVTFSSRVLRKNLENVERVFPYIITIGKALEDKAASFSDLLKQYYLENIGDMVLRLAKQYLDKQIKKHYGLEKLSSMSPGSLKDWPITEQKPLFSLFRTEKNPVGVKLTEHMLMIPRKSISGIYFPAEVTFLSCQLCPRERCPARKAPYDEDLKKKYGLDDE